jgi:hypothetical protein
VAHPTFGQDEQKLKDNLQAMKDIVGKVKDQPWRMRRKLKLYRSSFVSHCSLVAVRTNVVVAKIIICRLGHIYIERYEGRLSKGVANVAIVAKVRCQKTLAPGNCYLKKTYATVGKNHDDFLMIRLGNGLFPCLFSSSNLSEGICRT